MLNFKLVTDGHYHLAVPEHGLEFDADRLRRDRHELVGELSVSCGLIGSKAVDGVLSVGSFNFSSPRARQERAKLLATQSRAPKIDWHGLLEEVCQRVLDAERKGQPSVLLRSVPRPEPESEHLVMGLTFPKQHPSILFGDGGTCKSYLALYIAGILDRAGEHVVYFDWEMDDRAHRDRLERLFAGDGQPLPAVRYIRCDKPLVYEVDRLKRSIRDDQSTFAIFDSVAYATDGAPESAEAAMAYLRIPAHCERPFRLNMNADSGRC